MKKKINILKFLIMVIYGYGYFLIIVISCSFFPSGISMSLVSNFSYFTSKFSVPLLNVMEFAIGSLALICNSFVLIAVKKFKLSFLNRSVMS